MEVVGAAKRQQTLWSFVVGGRTIGGGMPRPSRNGWYAGSAFTPKWSLGNSPARRQAVT
jgi:hypothetical protein